METKRQLDVLDQRLADRDWIADSHTIAMAMAVVGTRFWAAV